MKRTLRNLTPTLPLVICLLLPAITRAETAVQAWVQRYNGPGNSYDQVTAVAVDGSNNVIVTGNSVNGTSYDYATIKYSSAGLPLWTNFYNGPGNDYDGATAVAVDASNNVIVAGRSDGGASGDDYATIKYSNAGLPLWTNRYDGPGNGRDWVSAVVVDGNNDVIVTGRSADGGSGYDYATIKYSSAGVPLWTNRYSGPGNSYKDDYAYAVAVDSSNNVIVTGYAWGSASSRDYVTIKYSSAGVPLWTNRYNGPGSPDATHNAVAVDGSNNVIVTGESIGNGSFDDYATIKYSSAGAPLWTNRYHGPANVHDAAKALAVDGNNDVIVTGNSASTNGPPPSYDYATIKYSSAGVPLWTNRYNGPGNAYDLAQAVAVDGGNNVIVTGWSVGGRSAYDYATIKYSSAGVPIWTNRYAGPGNGSYSAQAVAVDRSGNVIVTGSSSGSGTTYDYVTIKYVVPLVITGFKPTNGTFQMLLDNFQPGPVVIEASTSLAGWTPVFTNTTPTNVLFYTDPDAGNLPTRFYRTFQFP